MANMFSLSPDLVAAVERRRAEVAAADRQRQREAEQARARALVIATAADPIRRAELRFRGAADWRRKLAFKPIRKR